MKSVIVIFLLILLNSCEMNMYSFNSNQMKIVRKVGSINSVTIETEGRSVFEIFDAIDYKRSSEFSLKTFSPDYFRCTGGSFKFDTGVVYFIKMHPNGDRTQSPIKVVLRSDGKIVKVP